MVNATIIFGKKAVDYYGETGIVPALNWLNNNIGEVFPLEFNTQSESDAYIKGVTDSLGWDDFHIIQHDKNIDNTNNLTLIKQNKELWVTEIIEGKRHFVEKDETVNTTINYALRKLLDFTLTEITCYEQSQSFNQAVDSFEFEVSDSKRMFDSLCLVIDIALLEIPDFDKTDIFKLCERAYNMVKDKYKTKELYAFLYPLSRFETTPTNAEIIEDFMTYRGDDPIYKRTLHEIEEFLNADCVGYSEHMIRFIEY